MCCAFYTFPLCTSFPHDMYLFLIYMFGKYFLDMVGISKIAMPNRMIKLSYFSFSDFPIFSTEIPPFSSPPPYLPSLG